MSQTPPSQSSQIAGFSPKLLKIHFFGSFLFVLWLLRPLGALGHLSKLPCVNASARNMSFQELGIKGEHQILEDSQYKLKSWQHSGKHSHT